MDFVNPLDNSQPTESIQGLTPTTPSGPLHFVNPLATAAGQAVHFVNPLDAGQSPSVGGFLGNLVGGVKAMVSGLGNIIGQGVHDVIQLAHGPSALNDPNNFELFNTAKAMVGFTDHGFHPTEGALLKDYMSRYGWNDFSHGDIWGGIKDIGTGLYNNPLSYVGDALMVGGAAAKLGEMGVLGESLGSKVLGETVAEARAGLKPVTEAATMTGNPGEAVAMNLSTNPVARLLQDKLYSGLFEINPEKAANWAAYRNPAFGGASADIGAYNRANEAINLAKDSGIPVLRPVVSRAFESHGISKGLSALGISVEDKAAQTTRMIMDQVSALDASQKATLTDVIEGTATDVQAPLVRPTPRVMDPAFESQYNVPFQELTPTRDGAFAESVSKNYPRGQWRMLQDGETTGAPYGMNDVLGTRVRIQSADPTLADAPTIIQDVAERTGYSVEAVKNGFADNGSWDGYVAQLRGPNGSLVEVGVETPILAQEQAKWGNIAGRVEGMQAQLDAARAAEAAGNPIMSEADMAKLEDEIAAGQAMNEYSFRYTRRKVAETLGGVAYDARAQAADAISAINHNTATRVALRDGMTFRSLWDRAFLPRRSVRWADQMTSMEKELADTYTTIIQNGGKVSDAIDPTMEILDRYLGNGHPAITEAMTEALMRSNVDEVIPFSVDQTVPAADQMVGLQSDVPTAPGTSGTLATGEKTILSDNSWWGPKGATDPAAGARYVMDRIRRLTHDSIVINGEFPTYTWKDMLLDAEANPMGDIPQYFPHLRKRIFNAENMWTSKGRSVLNSESNRLAKDEAQLFEAGMYERDPAQAYARVARELTKHTDMKDVLLQAVQRYGREVTPEELQAVALRALPTAERYVSMSGINALTDARNEFIVLKNQGLMDGLDATEATTNALHQMSDAALSAAAKRLQAGEAMAEPVWALPEHIAKAFDNFGKQYLKLPTKASFFYSTLMNAWKTSVLGLSPRWIVNNTLGNLVYMGVEDPAAIRYYAEMLSASRRAYVEQMFGADVTQAVYRDFMHGEMSSQIPLSEKAAQAGMPRLSAALSNLSESRLAFLGRGVKWLSDKVFKLNEINEQAARMGMAISESQRVRMLGTMSKFEDSYAAMRDVMSNGALDSTEINSVINKVDKTLGAYLQLSPAEKMVKQYLAPFYPFYRHTALFIARMPFENPAKFRILTAIDQIDKEMRPYLPDYRRSSYEIAPGMWVNLGAANPLEAVTQAYAPAITNPLLGVAIQRLTGTNPFGQQWVAPGKVFETQSGQKYEILRNPDGSYAGVKPVTGNWEPPLTETVLSMVPQWGLVTGWSPFKQKSFPARAAGFAGVSISHGLTAQQYAYYQALNAAQAMTAGPREYAQNP